MEYDTEQYLKERKCDRCEENKPIALLAIFARLA